MHRIWKIDPGVTLRAFSVTDPVPELTDELRAVIPAAEIVEVLVRQFERGLQYVQGRFERILEPGRYLFWNHPGARTSVQVLDTRVQQLKIHHPDRPVQRCTGRFAFRRLRVPVARAAPRADGREPAMRWPLELALAPPAPEDQRRHPPERKRPDEPHHADRDQEQHDHDPPWRRGRIARHPRSLARRLADGRPASLPGMPTTQTVSPAHLANPGSRQWGTPIRIFRLIR